MTDRVPNLNASATKPDAPTKPPEAPPLAPKEMTFAQTSARARSAGEWMDEQERYLESTGWKRTGSNDRGAGVWDDPAAGNGRATSQVAVELPKKSGGTETVYQMVGPPCQWSYVTEEAYGIQRARERAGQTLQQTIDRRKAELVELETKLAEQVERMAAQALAG